MVHTEGTCYKASIIKDNTGKMEQKARKKQVKTNDET